MNTYSSLRKQNNGSAAAVSTMVLCVVLSATILFSRLVAFVTADTRLYIPLTESSGITTVTVGRRDENGNITFRDNRYNRADHILLTAKPGIQFHDGNTVWDGKTDLKIFQITYSNGEQKVTVNGSGDKVIAPGTDNIYRFSLENTVNVPVDYTLTMEAYCEVKDANDATIRDIYLPVQARVTEDYNHKYLLGTADSKVPVMGLNGVRQTATVGVGKTIPYTLEWEWPFEGDDAYDTLLGNMAADLKTEGGEIRLTIVINTTSSYSTDSDNDDGIPKTGDESQVLIFGGLMAASGMMLIILLMPRRRREETNG